MVKIHKPVSRNSAVKLYANVPSRSRPGLQHTVTYMRKAGIERWTCTCEDQNIKKIAARKNCTHIRQVKSQLSVTAEISGSRPILSTVA